MNEIITFSLVALLLVISPGPNGFLVIKTLAAEGITPAFFNILGLTVATYFHGAFSIFGLSALLLQSAELFLVVKVIGAVYLLFIGLKAIFQTFGKTSNLPPKNIPQDGSLEKTNRHKITYFMEGFLTQMLNPKVSMFYLAAFPQFISLEQSSSINAFMLVAIHASIIFLWFSGLIKSISAIRLTTRRPFLTKWIQLISGIIMVFFGSLLLSHKA